MEYLQLKGTFFETVDTITLKISIIDRARTESNEVVFPFTFEHGAKSPYQYQLPAPFDQGGIPRVGYIHVDLFEPTQM